MHLSSTFRTPSEQIAHERLDGHVIAINLTTGTYFSMSESAADVWTLVAQGSSLEDTSRVLSALFIDEVPVADIKEFVQLCVDHEILEPEARGNEVTDIPNDWPRSRWVKPILEVHNDLQDLILIDPIHDASVLGWPATDAQSN